MAEQLEVEAIIPAYNEEKTILDVLDILTAHLNIKKIFVVDDGSSDDTVEKVRDFIQEKSLYNKVTLIQQKNQGKTAAVQTGFKKTQAPIILMLDADLVDLKPEHISVLIDPVLDGETVMTIGLFRGGRPITDLAHRINPNLSGQRAMTRECLDKVEWEKIKDFGLESHLTDLINIYHWKVKEVNLIGVTHRMKTEKRGFLLGWFERGKMWLQVIVQDWKRQTGWAGFLKRIFRSKRE